MASESMHAAPRRFQMNKRVASALPSEPKVLVSQPVRGREIALATPNEVMTQVPWSGETPRSPEIAGIDTFAMDVSSTFMNVASDNAMVPMVNAVPCNGAGCGGAIGLFSSAMLVSHPA